MKLITPLAFPCLILMLWTVACGGTQEAKAYSNRGETYRKRGQYERAIQDFDETIRLDPQFALAYYLRGVANQALGNDSAADRDFKKASDLGYAP